MPEEPTADDLEKAHLILSEFGLLIGPAERCDCPRGCCRDCAWTEGGLAKDAPER
jgi:hypothetical protein